MPQKPDLVLAQVGCGYWGPNLLRVFSSRSDTRVKWVAEPRPERQAFIREACPGARLADHWKKVLDDREVEAVVVATPAGTHFEIVKAALEAGKHVLVEKPLATTVRDADELARMAASHKRVLMAGHTFLYNDAVRFLKGLIDKGELGKVYYLYSQRLNLGQIRTDVNAWLNLAPHDVSIMMYLLGGRLPVSCSARGMNCIQPGIEDVVFANLEWDDRVAAHIHVSWLDPSRARRMTVVGEKKMVIYDDAAEDKIAVIDKGIDRVPRLGERMDYDRPDSYQLRQRQGDAWLPRIEFKEPLKAEAAHFVECIRGGKEPLTGPRHARDVVAVLEAVQNALRAGARTPVEAAR